MAGAAQRPLWVLAAHLWGAAALRAKGGAGRDTCSAVLEQLLPGAPHGERDLIEVCLGVYPEAVCRAAHGELHRGAPDGLMASVSSGAACRAVDAALQGLRRRGASPAGADVRLFSAASLDESLQRKAFEWEEQTHKPGATWIDYLVERVHQLHRTYDTAGADLPAWVRDLSKYVTTSPAPQVTLAPDVDRIAQVTGSMDLAVSNVESFAVDPNMNEVVRSGIADIVEVPLAYVAANMTLPTAASGNRTRVDYTIDIPFASSKEAALQRIQDALGALTNAAAAGEEVGAFISAAVDKRLGENIYTLSVTSITRPQLEVHPTTTTTTTTTTSTRVAGAPRALEPMPFPSGYY